MRSQAFISTFRCPVLTEISWDGRANFCPILEITGYQKPKISFERLYIWWIQQASLGSDITAISIFKIQVRSDENNKQT